VSPLVTVSAVLADMQERALASGSGTRQKGPESSTSLCASSLPNRVDRVVDCVALVTPYAACVRYEALREAAARVREKYRMAERTAGLVWFFGADYGRKTAEEAACRLKNAALARAQSKFKARCVDRMRTVSPG
jgi:hypothetical protein